MIDSVFVLLVMIAPLVVRWGFLLPTPQELWQTPGLSKEFPELKLHDKTLGFLVQIEFEDDRDRAPDRHILGFPLVLCRLSWRWIDAVGSTVPPCENFFVFIWQSHIIVLSLYYQNKYRDDKRISNNRVQIS